MSPKNLSIDLACLLRDAVLTLLFTDAGKPHSTFLTGLSGSGHSFCPACSQHLAVLTRLMSCSPVSEAVMSLHSAWRAGLGRPEPRERSRSHLPGSEFQVLGTEGGQLQAGLASDMFLCGLGQEHVASREEEP